MATGYCPADCADDALIPNAPTNCDLQPRKNGIDRIGFFSCGIDLPAPFDCAALEALVAANTLVFSNPLRNVVVNDPETEDFQLADCLPSIRQVLRRVIEFQDVIAVSVTSPTSPTFTVDPFYDYAFWADKKSRSFVLRYLFIMCDGSVRVPRDEQGNPMQASLDIFLSLERQGTGATSYTMEIKKGRLEFLGDPLDFQTPELDADDEIFYITDCDISL